jgi:universal stress protein E
VRAIRRILVAIKKPDVKTLPALEKAAQLARGFGAEIELFHALSTPLFSSGLGITAVTKHVAATHRMKVKDRLERLAGPLRKQGLLVTTHAGWDFPAAEAIIRRAARIDAGLIIAECDHGEHRGGWLLKLTDWELVRLSDIPVLLVKSKRQYRHPVVLAAVDPSHSYAKPARLDDQILQCARSVRQALRGSLHVVHAHGPMAWEGRRFMGLDPHTSRILRERSRADAVARLKP